MPLTRSTEVRTDAPRPARSRRVSPHYVIASLNVKLIPSHSLALSICFHPASLNNFSFAASVLAKVHSGANMCNASSRKEHDWAFLSALKVWHYSYILLGIVWSSPTVALKWGCPWTHFFLFPYHEVTIKTAPRAHRLGNSVLEIHPFTFSFSIPASSLAQGHGGLLESIPTVIGRRQGDTLWESYLGK